MTDNRLRNFVESKTIKTIFTVFAVNDSDFYSERVLSIANSWNISKGNVCASGRFVKVG